MKERTPTTKDEARQYAIDWQNWASGVPMSWGEVVEWSSRFEKIGKRFGLLKEFKENGII